MHALPVNKFRFAGVDIVVYSACINGGAHGPRIRKCIHLLNLINACTYVRGGGGDEAV